MITHNLPQTIKPFNGKVEPLLGRKNDVDNRCWRIIGYE